MRKRLSLALALVLAPLQAPAQTPTQQPAPTPAAQQTQTQPTPTPTPQDDSDDGDVVRITANLVQFDAVVNDKKGRQVTDLQPDEFEVTVNGKRQTITNFSYVVAQPGAEAPATAAQPAPRAGGK